MPTSRLAIAFSLAFVACTAEGLAPASDAGTRKETPGATCGDGDAEFGEVCDGDTVACAELELSDGLATCYADCSGYNTDACLGPDVCGNRLLEDGERCDELGKLRPGCWDELAATPNNGADARVRYRVVEESWATADIDLSSWELSGRHLPTNYPERPYICFP